MTTQPNEREEFENHHEILKECIYCFSCGILEFDGDKWVPESQLRTAQRELEGAKKTNELCVAENRARIMENLNQGNELVDLRIKMGKYEKAIIAANEFMVLTATKQMSPERFNELNAIFEPAYLAALSEGKDK